MKIIEFTKLALIGTDSPDIAGIHGTILHNTSAAAAVVPVKDNGQSADPDFFFSFTNPELGVCGGFEVNKDVITMSNGAGYGFEDYEY